MALLGTKCTVPSSSRRVRAAETHVLHRSLHSRHSNDVADVVLVFQQNEKSVNEIMHQVSAPRNRSPTRRCLRWPAWGQGSNPVATAPRAAATKEIAKTAMLVTALVTVRTCCARTPGGRRANVQVGASSGDGPRHPGQQVGQRPAPTRSSEHRGGERSWYLRATRAASAGRLPSVRAVVCRNQEAIAVPDYSNRWPTIAAADSYNLGTVFLERGPSCIEPPSPFS